MAARTLTELENRMLDYAASGPRYSEHHVIEEFGWRTPVFLARLHVLIDDPAAERERPMDVRRLQRMRDERRARRSMPFSSRSTRTA